MKNYKIEIKWAVIFVLASLLWMLIERIVGLHDAHIDKQATYSILFAIPAIAIYVFALNDKKKNFYKGTMTYWQGFLCGIIISLIVTVFTPLTQIITAKVITPNFYANAIKFFVSSGSMTQEVAEKYFTLKNSIIQGLIGAPFMGLITTSIVSFFTKIKLK